MYLKLENLNYLIKYIVTSLLLFACFGAFSQDEIEEPIRADRYVYFNPGALLNIPSGFQIGYEQKIRKNWYCDVEGGILLFTKTPTLLDFNATNRKGFRFQAGTKFFATKHFFIGPQFLYKRVSMDEQEWLWRYDNLYQQRFDMRRVRRTFAAAAEFGWSFGFIDSPITLDIAYGLGVQNFHVRYNDLPLDANLSNLTSLETEPGTTILPFFNYKIKLKYALKGEPSPKQGKDESLKKNSHRKKSKKRKRSKGKVRD